MNELKPEFTIPDTNSNTISKKKLFEHPDLWRAGQLPAKTRSLSTGFAQLDAHLPGHGWPESGLSELLLPTAGIGELQLLMPLLRQQSRKMRWIAWINAPFLPYAPALEAAGVDISKILLIHPKDHKDALWALERASRSGTCSLALAWLDEQKLTFKDTRALQLAAKQGTTLTCLFRPPQAASESSMAELRLQLDVSGASADQAAADLQVSVLKRRGGWPVNGLRLTLPEKHSDNGDRQISEQLSLWRAWRGSVAPAAAASFAVAGSAPLHGDNIEQHISH